MNINVPFSHLKSQANLVEKYTIDDMRTTGFKTKILFMSVTGLLLVNPVLTPAQNTSKKNQQESINIKMDLARLYIKKKHYSRAIKLLQRAYQLKPDDPVINIELGLAYYLSQDIPRALSYYEKIQPFILKNNKANLIKRLAFAYWQMQLFDQAIPLFEKLTKLTPQDEQVYLTLGHIFKKRGQTKQAADLYETTFQIMRLKYKTYSEELAFSFKDINHLKRAEDVFANLFLRQPDNYRYLMELADLKANQPSKKKNFILLLKRAQQLVPVDDAYYSKLLAYRLFVTGQYKEALSRYEAMHQLAKDDFDVLLSLAGLYQKVGQSDKSLQFYQQAKAQLSQAKNVSIGQVRALAFGFRQFKYYDDVLALLKSIQSPDYQIQMDLGDTYYLLRNLSQAKKYYQLALSQWTDKKEDNLQALFIRYVNLSHIHYRLGAMDKALNSLDLARKVVPDEASSYTQLAYQYRLHQQFKQSNQLLLDPLVQNFPTAEVYIALGDNSFDLKQDKEAELYYLTALELVEDNKYERYKSLALGFLKIKQFARAEQLITSLIAQKPEDYQLLLQVARLAREKKQTQVALKTLGKVASLMRSDDGDMWRELGNEYLQLQYHDRSLKHLKQALNYRPDDHQIYLMIGHNYQALGRYPLALENYERVLDYEDSHAESVFNLGLIKRALGRPQAAIKHFLEAREIDKVHHDQAEKLIKDIQSNGFMIGDINRYFFDVSTLSNELFLKAKYTSYFSSATHHDWETKYKAWTAKNYHVTNHLLLNYENFLADSLDVHRASTGVKVKSEYFFNKGISSASITPQLMYNFASGQNTILHYGSASLTAGLKPIPSIGIETSGQYQFGNKDLFLGSFLNYRIRAKGSYLFPDIDFSLAALSQFQNYEIFDGLARLRNIYRFENGLESTYKDDYINYVGAFTFSTISGEIEDMIIEVRQRIKYNFWGPLSLTGNFNLTKFFLDLQQPQSVLSPSIGLEYAIPLPAGFPLALEVQGRYNYFFDNQRPGFFHYLVSLKTRL